MIPLQESVVVVKAGLVNRCDHVVVDGFCFLFVRAVTITIQSLKKIEWLWFGGRN